MTVDVSDAIRELSNVTLSITPREEQPVAGSGGTRTELVNLPPFNSTGSIQQSKADLDHMPEGTRLSEIRSFLTLDTLEEGSLVDVDNRVYVILSPFNRIRHGYNKYILHAQDNLQVTP